MSNAFALNAEQREVAEKNYYLIHWFMTRKRMPPGIDYDDYLSFLCQYYCRSIATHDPEKSKISTYVIQMLTWARIQFLRNHYKRQDTSISTVSIHGDNDTDVVHPATYDDQDRGMLVRQRIQLTNELLSTLGPVKEEIMRMYLRGVGHTDIAKKMGISRQRIKQIYDKSIRLMQRQAKLRKLSIDSAGIR